MVITKLVPQKNGSRFNLYLDNKFTFGVSTFVASKYKLQTDLVLTIDQLQQIYIDEQVEHLKQRALDFLSARPRSESEVKNKLKERLQQQELAVSFSTPLEDLNTNIINEVLTFLKKYNYVNDYDFAKWLVEQRTSQGKGEQFIKQDLFKKGVEKEVIAEVLQQVDSSDALQKTYTKALKKYEKEQDKYKKRQKIQRYMLYRGFTFDQISKLEY